MRWAIIPARGGSRRIFQKNIRDFMGKPIIAYSIEAAQASGLFDKIIVSTDDNKIGAIAWSLGATIQWRDAEHSQNEVGTQDVMRYVCLELGVAASDVVCCIYPTAPLMRLCDLTDGCRALEGRPGTTFVFSVGYPDLRDAGQFYWGTGYAFRVGLPLININTRMLHIPDDHVCDINTMTDWKKAERMYRKLHP